MFEPTVVPESEKGSGVPGPGLDVDLDLAEFEPTDADVDEAFAEMWSLQRGLTGPGDSTVADWL